MRGSIPEWKQLPHSSTLPAFAIIVVLIFGVALFMPLLLFGDEALALHKRFPLPIRSTDPDTLIPHTLAAYWPLVLTVVASHWRMLAPPRSEPEMMFLPAVLAFATMVLLHILTGVLVALAWLLRKLGLGGETLLACVVLAFAYAPLEPLLRAAIRRVKAEHELRSRTSSSSG
jgi:hypothetical protein